MTACIAAAPVVDAAPIPAPRRTKRARTTPVPRHAPRPAPAAPALFLAPGSVQRAKAIAAIALLNEALNMPGDERGWDAAYDADRDGYAHLQWARSEVLRALMPPEARASEVRRAQQSLAQLEGGANNAVDLARACGQQALALFHASYDVVPGGLLMRKLGLDSSAMDRIGTDPEVVL